MHVSDTLTLYDDCEFVICIGGLWIKSGVELFCCETAFRICQILVTLICITGNH